MIILVFTFAVFLFLSNQAYAYIDPGTGGSILQIILAFLAGFFSLIVFYLKKIKFFINKAINKFKKKI
jgi:hypothetical protein